MKATGFGSIFARVVILAAALMPALAPVESVRASEPLESLTVTYNTYTCRPPDATAADLRAPIVAIVNSVGEGSWYQQTLPVGSSPGPFVEKFKVAPDAYYIYGQQKQTNCRATAGIVEIVLPGRPVSVKVDLAPCCGDEIAYSYVAGLVSPGLDVQIKRSPAELVCGSSIDETALQSLEGADSQSRKGNAYYGELSLVTVGTLVLEVVSENGKKAFVRLVLRQNGHVSIESTYKRVDVDQALFEAASSTSGSLFCPTS